MIVPSQSVGTNGIADQGYNVVSSTSQPSLFRYSWRRVWSPSHGDQVGIQRSAWAISDQAVVSLASFLSTILVGRFCSPDQLGVYTLAVGGFWLINGFPNALVWTPYTSRAPRMAGSRRARYAGSVLSHLAAILTVVCGALVLLAAGALAAGRALWIETAASFEFAFLFLALIPFVVMMTLREHVRRVHMAHLEMRELLRVDLPIAFTQVALMGVLAYYQRLSAMAAILVIALACSISAMSLIVRHGEIEFRSELARLHFAYNFGFGRWLVVASLAWLVSENSYRWLMWRFHGLDSVGQMAAALYIVLLVNPLLVSICYFTRAVMANQLAECGAAEINRTALRATALMGLGFGGMFGALAVYGGDLVALLYGKDYAGQDLVVAMFCLAIFFRAVAVPVDAALMALRRGKLLATGAIVQLCFALVTGGLLIHAFGAVGAGCAMATSDGISLAVRWVLFRRIDGVSLRGYSDEH